MGMDDNKKMEKFDPYGDVYKQELKSITNEIIGNNLDVYLKSFFENSPSISTYDIFDATITKTLLAIEYGFEKKNNVILDLVKILVDKLEKKSPFFTLDNLFASLIRRAISLGESGISIQEMRMEIQKGPEFENIVVMFLLYMTSLGKTNEEPFDFNKHYSNN